MDHSDLIKILKDGGCLDFIGAGADRALEKIRTRRPEGWNYLAGEAEDCLRENYWERMELIYMQALFAEVRSVAERYDPAGVLLGKFRPETVKRAAKELTDAADGDPEKYLHEKYPLLSGYQRQITENFIDHYSDFLQAFVSEKEKISERLLDGRPVTKILHLTNGGADIHRNGRCVIGVKTDAGTVFYKPHDCGMDVLYHEIAARWFSDCTEAPDVVEGALPRGRNGADTALAFVSCLKHEPVSCEQDIADYYYHFGILAALFHGLGSSDMHLENIVSCGNRPSAVDMETILGTAVRADEAGSMQETLKIQQEFSDSLMRTCLLPMRAYKGAILSPLHSVISRFESL